MKKGFTLIELLAVIVILAIIALIATPIVLNIINDTRESAKIRSAELYIDALEQAIMRKKMNQNIGFNPSSCTITSGVITCDGESIQVEVDGTVPSEGSITLINGKVESYELDFDDKKVIYENGETTLQDQVIKLGGLYTLKNDDVATIVATEEEVDSYAINVGSIVVLSDGSEWIYLSSNGNIVTLLSKYNHFTSGPNIGEMDSSGNINATVSRSGCQQTCECMLDMSLEECPEDSMFCIDNVDSCDFTIENFINNTIKPKLASSLGIAESTFEVGIYTFSGIDTPSFMQNMIPKFWILNTESGQYIGTETETGIRTTLTIDKSNINLILNNGYGNLEISSIAFTGKLSGYEVLKETKEYVILYLGADPELQEVYLTDPLTGYTMYSSASSISILGYSISYVEDDNGWGYTVDWSMSPEGVDTERVKTIMSSVYSLDQNIYRFNGTEANFLQILK